MVDAFDDSSQTAEKAQHGPFRPRSTVERIVAAALALLIVGICVSGYVQWRRSAKGAAGDEPDLYGGASVRAARSGTLQTPQPRILERNGKRLLWARNDPDSDEAEWFDVTNSTIDPETFQYGIGKDTIASIDEPTFVDADDPRLREAGIDDHTIVIGYAHEGEAKAYPLHVLDRHELVNDTVGGKPVTVGW